MSTTLSMSIILFHSIVQLPFNDAFAHRSDHVTTPRLGTWPFTPFIFPIRGRGDIYVLNLHGNHDNALEGTVWEAFKRTDDFVTQGGKPSDSIRDFSGLVPITMNH